MCRIIFFVVVIVFTTQLYAQNLDSGLVVHYPFENNLDDTVGGLDGNSINGTVSYVSGISGMALQMPNTITPVNDNHRVEVTPWQPGDSSFTVSGWIYVGESELYPFLTSPRGPLITYQEGDFTHGFSLGVSVTGGEGSMGVGLRATGSISGVSSTCFDYGRWVHSVFTLNRNTGVLTLFIDGNEVDNGAFNETIVPTTGLIGGYDFMFARNGHTRYVTSASRLDEIRIYNRALTPTEIEALYISGNTNTISTTICSGETYTFGSQILTTSGTYTETYTTIGGCDSVVTLNLTVSPVVTNSLLVDICSGETYIFGTQTLSDSGRYIETFNGSNCDSIVSLALTVSNCEPSSSCISNIQNVLTPNGDGINDLWVIDNIDSYPNNKVSVYNLWGNIVFEMSDYTNNWNCIDGNGNRLPVGNYLYYIDIDSDCPPIKGSLTITY